MRKSFQSGGVNEQYKLDVNSETYEELRSKVQVYFADIMAPVQTTTKKSSASTPSPTYTQHWDYKQHGNDWGCCGGEQSPIDIATAQAAPGITHYLKLWWAVRPIKTTVIDNGHTLFVQSTVSRLVGSTPDASCHNALYEALQFHFHSPSEHTFDGKQYPLELHIVHTVTEEYFKAEAKYKRNLAVFGVLFEVDDSAPPNSFIDSLQLDNIGKEITLNMFDAFGHIECPEYYGYVGSLTTPPCSELVNWFIMKKPMTLTSAQLKLFNFGKDGNNRAVQDLGDRQVYCGNCNSLVDYHVRPSLATVPTAALPDASSFLVIDFKDFLAKQNFPTYLFDRDLLRPLSSINTDSAINVFISHAWLDSERGKVVDNEYNEKYKLCVDALHSIISLAAMDQCFIWIDCACAEPGTSAVQYLWQVMEFADCVLTPVPGDDIAAFDAFTGDLSYYSDYKVALWNGSPKAYVNQAKARVEMLYAAAVPISSDKTAKSKRFCSGMFIALQEGHRPHLLYGSKEKRERASPVFLPPLQLSYLQALNPLNGSMDDDERLEVEQLMEKIRPNIQIPAPLFNGKPLPRGGISNDKGLRVYSNGDKYDGSFVNGLRHGKGAYFYTEGDSYEGEWFQGFTHGRSKILFADGSVYEGRVQFDTFDGVGTYSFANGDVYSGYFKRNKPHGSNGLYKWLDGSKYRGGYCEGLFHGDGTFTASDGTAFSGVWVYGAYKRHFSFPFEKLSRALLVDILAVGKANRVRRLAAANASFRSEHCGHVHLVSQPLPEIDSQ